MARLFFWWLMCLTFGLIVLAFEMEKPALTYYAGGAFICMLIAIFRKDI